MPNTTIYDVAAAAGVSVKTVSRVINNEPNVSAEKQERVRAAIRDLNFRPDQAARRLKSRRSYLIGLVYAYPSHSYVLDVLEGALARSDQEHFDLLIRPCDVDSRNFVQHVVEFLDHSRTDGLVLIPPLTDNDELIETLKHRDVPFARISPRSNHDPLSVGSDEYRAAVEVTEHLISLGHKDIGFIGGHPDHGASIWRRDGYMAAMREAGIAIRDELVQEGDFLFESGENCARSLLSLDPRPTAIFAINDFMAAGAYKVAQQLGFAIPYDISIVGFDDAPVASQLWPPLTTVRQPTHQLGDRAAALLINRILQREHADGDDSLRCELVVRNSTGPVPSSGKVNREHIA